MIVNLRDAVTAFNQLNESVNEVSIPKEYAHKKVSELPTGMGLQVLHAMEREYPDEWVEDLWKLIHDVSPKSLNDTHHLGLIFEGKE